MAEPGGLRWGVLGATSRIYRNSLKPAIMSVSGHSIVAEASRAEGGEEAYAELLAMPEVDAVYVPLPNHLHVEWVERALDAGKHVLCEKPLTFSAPETEALFERAAAAERTLLEAYMWPHHPRARRVLELALSGDLGSVRSGHAVFTFPLDELTDHRLDERGRGSLYDVGIYCLGPFVLAAGRDPLSVHAAATRNETGADVSMTGLVDWGPAIDGSRLTTTFEVGFDAPGRRSLTLSGSQGAVSLTGWHAPGPIETSQILIDRREGDSESEDCEGADAYAGLVAQFADVVHLGIDPIFGAPESIRLARVIDRLHAAAT